MYVCVYVYMYVCVWHVCMYECVIFEKDNCGLLGEKLVMLFNDDDSRVSEKIVKARRALNASAGLGIRRNGLTMRTCNILYWSVIIPILTFGSEICHVTESDYEAVIDFQIYTGRRLQRFPPRSPRSSSFFGLGWVRITTYILVKKLLFVLSIFRLKDNSIIRELFCRRAMDFKNLTSGLNKFRSPTHDMLWAAKRLGLHNLCIDMIEGNIAIIGKKAWAKLVWEKAWILEDVYWDSTKLIHKDNELLYTTLCHTRYMS